MREIATTLTDFAMTLFSMGCALLLLRRPAIQRGMGSLIFFTAFASAAFFGGLWHGFFSAPDAPGERFVWWLSMVSGGVSGAGLGIIGIELMGLRHRTALLASMLGLMAFFSIYVWFDPRFLATLVATACGSILCLLGALQGLRRGVGRPAVMILAALGISVAAALGQQSGVALHPVHFDHNATYHLFLFPALGLFYAGLRRITF